MKRIQSRKWQITINNPQEHGFDHDRIREALFAFKGMIYWCMCDEEGDECKTLHTHVYFVLRSPTNADVVSSRFPGFHRDTCHGTSPENRAYILKDGEKFNKREDGSYDYVDGSGKRHEGINFSDTFEEWGDLPSEHQGKSNDCVKMLMSQLSPILLSASYIKCLTAKGRNSSAREAYSRFILVCRS